MTVMTRFGVRLLLLPSWMIAFAILIKGYGDTGDGFSAGVVASLGVLLQYLVFGVEPIDNMPVVRYTRQLSAIGLLLALAVTFTPLLWGETVLTHSPDVGEPAVHVGSVELITAFVFDIGIFLLVLGFCIGCIDLVARATSRKPS
jgi:multisubunit Na+/H+ antiporter MnhB subunit